MKDNDSARGYGGINRRQMLKAMSGIPVAAVLLSAGIDLAPQITSEDEAARLPDVNLGIGDIDPNIVLASTIEDYQITIRRYFDDMLNHKKAVLVADLLQQVLQLDSDSPTGRAIAETLGPARTEELRANAHGVLPDLARAASGENIAGTTAGDILSFVAENPNTFVSINSRLYGIDRVVADERLSSGERRLVCVRAVPVAINSGDIRYEYRQPLERYDPLDRTQVYQVLPEVNAAIEEVSGFFGIPKGVLEAVLVIEGGGGAENPGLNLSAKSQEHLVNNGIDTLEAYLVNPETGALGPMQTMPDTVDTFRGAAQLVWGDEQTGDPHNFKTSLAIGAAKLYVDAYALAMAEPYRYTVDYLEVLRQSLDIVYAAVKNANAGIGDGLAGLLREQGARNMDPNFYFLAGAFYLGESSTRFPRLGGRRYDEFITAYYYSMQEADTEIAPAALAVE